MGLLAKLIDRRIGIYQRELIETHYTEVENMYRQMRGWRHDYRSHIQVMKAHAAAGDLEAVQAYLDKLDADLTALDPAVRTGNAMVDAILNSKISLARSREISVRADANIPVALRLSELDLCVIIGNLFDNAIELKADPGVYGDQGRELYISFTNLTAAGKRKKVSGRFATTKGEGHGFGLVRIDNIVERLGGYITRSSEEGAFSTEILIPVS